LTILTQNGVSPLLQNLFSNQQPPTPTVGGSRIDKSPKQSKSTNITKNKSRKSRNKKQTKKYNKL